MKLTASYLTLAGAPFGKPARYGIAQRSQAASDAGWSGIGAGTWERYRACRHLPCPVTELEWAELGRPFTRKDADAFMRMADHLGAVTRINAGCGIAGASKVTDSDVAGRLTILASAAASRGITVALEPVAFGPCWHPARIMRLIRMADMPNVGYLFDVWHQARAHDMGARVTVPVHLITEVQLSGYTPPKVNTFTDAMNRELTDTCAMAQLAHLMRRGYHGPVDVEATSDHMQSLPLALMALDANPGAVPRPMAAPASMTMAQLSAMARNVPAMMDTRSTRVMFAAFGVTS